MNTPTHHQPAAIKGRPSDFVPEAFRLMGVPAQERPATACASCPSAIWHFQGEWRSFCNLMKFVSWQGKGSPIAVCDGRETALAKLEEHRRNLTDR
jgi:hypothetical protein